MKKFCQLFLLLSATLMLRAAAFAQIFYINVDNQGNGHLAQINADGSGNTAISLPFLSVSNPNWSHDGNVVALTAIDPDPQKAGQHSTNVFAYTRATGVLTRVTNFEDQFGPNVVSYTFPNYKACSPDRSAVAVMSLVDSEGSGSSVLPVLEIFTTQGGNAIEVLQGTERHYESGGDHGGEGVDWSPDGQRLATPLSTDTPYQSNPSSSGTVTAIFLVVPEANAKFNGHIQQITAPRTDFNINAGTLTAEHDYMPRFSPNGAGLAYVRSFQSVSSSSQVPNGDVQSLHILNLNTGADSQIAQFPQGVYVTTMDWSPNGTALVFDLGLQPNSVTGPQQQGNPATDQTYLINTDGSNLHQLLGSGSGQPSWRPTVVTAPATLGNISTRVPVGGGDSSAIAGFIITGSASKQVLIRGIGPSLAQSGVQGTLSDPLLELHQGSTTLLVNDNWQDGPNVNQIPNGFTPSDPHESVIVATLSPGSYTAILRDVHGETGVGLVEAYDLSSGSASKMANISTRSPVGTGDSVLIGGFIAVGDNGSAQVVVRGIGPSLTAAGVAGALQDPTLDIYNSNGSAIASNDDWKSSQQAALEATGIAPTDDREAAILTALPSGNYTAIVRGKNNTTGIGLVEIYQLQ